MSHPYAIADTSAVFSPALLFFKDLIRQNIAAAVKLAGDPARLRPHAKTHKTREIARLALDAGITKHKCATIAEAEMLATAGAPDVFIAYPIVGPNCRRLAALIRAYPSCRFSVTADHPIAVDALSEVMAREGLTVDVLLDCDLGMHRTGIDPGDEAIALYQRIAARPGLRPDGLHAYDGHNHQEARADRQAAVAKQLAPVLKLRDALQAKGLPVPRIVGGGTPTFPVFAGLEIPGLECSPGTVSLHDQGYSARFADMPQFKPAALLLTRVISRPTATRVTFDLGYKAVASDPPAGKRLVLLDLPPHEVVLQNEEHLVIETKDADRFEPGDEALAIPTHVCPTVAMHQRAYVVEGGRVTGTWAIVGRDRVITL
jgi:D-serine deaminase-like pyridoxal phosphate-dependent protein